MVNSQALARIVRDVVLDAFSFPFWWYSKGLVRMLNWVAQNLMESVQSLGLSVWLKNLFVPMYGRYDWQSRIISFFMRLIQIGFRLLALCMWSLVVLMAFFLYLTTPIALTFIFFYNLQSLLA